MEIDIAVSLTAAAPVSFTSSSFIKPDSVKLFTGRDSAATDWAEVVLDYTYSPALSLELLQIAADSLVICMYEGCPDEEISSRLSPGDISERIGTLLAAFPSRTCF